MTEARKVEWLLTIFENVVVEGSGEITISTPGGHYGDEVDREFTVAELFTIASKADAHHRAYEAYKESGYVDGVYWAMMEEHSDVKTTT